MKTFLEKVAGFILSVQYFGWGLIYLGSIYQTFQDRTFMKMVAMIVLPPFAQIYLFIERWVRFGFYNTFGMYVVCNIMVLGIGLLLTWYCSVSQKDTGVLDVDYADPRRPSLNTHIGEKALIWLLIAGAAIIFAHMLMNTLGRELVVSDLSTGENRSIASYESLKGAFGVKFGDKTDMRYKAVAEDAGSGIYEFTPAQKFREFGGYYVLASKISKTIYLIRAEAVFDTKKEMEDEIESVKKLVSLKYGISFINSKEGWVAKLVGKKNDPPKIVIINGSRMQDKWALMVSYIDAGLGEMAYKEAERSGDRVNKRDMDAL